MKAFTAMISLFLLLTPLQGAHGAPGATGAIERVQSSSEHQIRNLLEPILEKYCRDQCKLMNVKASVDIAVPEEVSPGFDDIDPQSASRLAPTEARARILMDEKIGPISQRKLLDLIQRHLDTLDYPVKVETQQAHFPQPLGISGKVAELREKVARRFKDTLQQLFTQYCPDHCMASDFDLITETVNAEEAQYGATNEFFEDGGVAIRVKSISSTLLVDEALPPEERQNLLDMAKLRTGDFRNAALALKAIKFPGVAQGRGSASRGLAGYWGADGRWIASEGGMNSKETSDSDSTRTERSESQDQSHSKNESRNISSSDSESRQDSKSTSNLSENSQKQERFERFEKIERVESGDAVQAELQKIKVYALVFACAVLSLLIFIALSSFRARGGSLPIPGLPRFMGGSGPQAATTDSEPRHDPDGARASLNEERSKKVASRYETERLTEELLSIFSQSPKVAKQVFSRLITEEGIETTAACISIFGESIVIDMLRDPSLQGDVNELMEFYAKTPIELEDTEKLDLLKRLHNRTVAGKLVILGSRSSHQFEFLADMDGLQILELIRNESLTVKAIIVTQCDPQKRSAIYAQLDDDTRMKLLAELSRIDYLPRDYITNVASALKRKRQDNPRLNTEALPGSDVLVSLLERSGPEMQMALVKNLERVNPDSARTVKNKLVSLGTLQHLRDSQLLEVVLSLRHDELLQFLKGAPGDVRMTILAKSPKDLSVELEDELLATQVPSREEYQALERKVLNRLKVMSNDGLINLAETNERMFGAGRGLAAVPEASGDGSMRRASG